MLKVLNTVVLRNAGVSIVILYGARRYLYLSIVRMCNPKSASIKYGSEGWIRNREGQKYFRDEITFKDHVDLTSANIDHADLEWNWKGMPISRRFERTLIRCKCNSLVISRDDNLYKSRCNNHILESTKINRGKFLVERCPTIWRLRCKSLDVIYSIYSESTDNGYNDISTCNTTCNTDLNIKNVTVYSYSGEGFIYMLIYLAGSGSIFHLLTASPDVATDGEQSKF